MDKRIKNILRCYAAGMGIKETAFIHPVIQSASMSACFFQVVRVIEQLLSLFDVQLEKCGIKKEAAPNGAAS